MKAMILAAGLGTRLAPLTTHRPKALVEIAGRPLLEHVIRKLIRAGIEEIIINLHHHAEQVLEFLASQNHFGIRIETSLEPELLDTGGGLKHAGWFFEKDETFVLYNTDVISNIDLSAMVAAHQRERVLVTLAVRKRTTSRYFLFDARHLLVGWEAPGRGDIRLCRPLPPGQAERLSFMGIHVIATRIFDLMVERGKFSIVDVYMRLAQEGQDIRAFRADRYAWVDCGRLENIEKAAALLKEDE